MKKVLYFLLLFSFSFVGVAKQLTQDEARMKAVSFLADRNKVSNSLHRSAWQSDVRVVNGQQGNLYVFNVGNNDGFVIVSGDDRIPAILGYSDSGHIDANHIAPSMKAWFCSYADLLTSISESQTTAFNVTGKSIAPLITAQWDQGAPYNRFCPDETYTGCVATAMAQVMFYHQWPAQTTQAIPAYTTYTYQIGIPEVGITAIDWANMLPTYKGNETTEQQNAVAILMRLCGQSLQMDYTDYFSGAGTPSIPAALYNYFDYDYSVKQIARTAYKSAEWNQLIYDELAAHRPVVYNGNSSGGGHAFVIDGYDKDNYFHVNWGWSGENNGYFLLAGLDPASNTGSGASTTTDGYNFWQGAVIGIQPQKGTQPAPVCLVTANAYASEGNEDPADNLQFTRQSIDEDFNTIIYIENSYTDLDISFDFAWGIFNTNGEMIGTSEVRTTNGYNYWESGARYWPLGKGLTDGVYTLKPISRLEGSATWYENVGADKYYITATISGNTITLKNTSNTKTPEPTDPVFALTGNLESVGKVEIYEPATIKATIQNQGDDYNLDVFLYVGDQQVAGNVLEVDHGKTATIEFTFTPQTLGEIALTLIDNDQRTIATGSVISTTPEASLNISAVVKNQLDNMVSRNQATITLNIVNTAMTDYTKDVIAALYKQGDDEQFYYVGEEGKFMTIKAGESADVNLTFGGLENGAVYLVNMFYLTPKGYSRSENYTWFAVKYQEGQLSILPSIANAVSYLDDNWTAVVNNKTVKMSYEVTNQGNADYQGELIADVLKFHSDGLAYPEKEVAIPVVLAANATKTFTLDIDNMEDGETYMIYVKYVSNGDAVQGYQYTPFFTINLAATTIDSPLAIQQNSVGIYSMEGRLVGKTKAVDIKKTLQSLPKGFYIIGGKKVAN